MSRGSVRKTWPFRTSASNFRRSIRSVSFFREGDIRINPIQFPPAKLGSEIELIDVGLVEDERLSEEDVVAFDFEGAEGTGFETLRTWFQFVLRDRHGRVHGQITEIARVPQHHAVRHAFVDVAFVFVGQAEADHLHLAGLAGLFNRFRRAGRARRANGHEELQVRVGAHQRSGFRLRLVLEIVAGTHGNEFHLGVFFGEALVDIFHPLALVAGSQGGGDDGKLALLAAQPRGFIHQAVGDAFGRGLIDKKGTRVGQCIGVESDYLDALLLRFAQGGGNAFLVFSRDRDDVHAEGNPVFNDFILLGCVGIGGPVEQQFNAEFLGRLFRADFAGDEVRIALGLGHHRDNQFRIGREHRGQAGEQSDAGGGKKTREVVFHRVKKEEWKG